MSLFTSGLSFSVGALHRVGTIGKEDGYAVAKIRAAGAIPLLVSNTPEYCTSWETDNFITGRTLNPHNSSRTPGGSSGGEVRLFKIFLISTLPKIVCSF